MQVRRFSGAICSATLPTWVSLQPRFGQGEENLLVLSALTMQLVTEEETSEEQISS